MHEHDAIVPAAPAPLASDEVRDFLVFGLDDGLYGVELSRLREIVSPPPITHVPRTPEDIVGICSVRGLLVTVVDLRRRLKLPPRRDSCRSRILLANSSSGEVIGLMVDEVRQVMRLSGAQIEFVSQVLGSDLSDHLLGMGRADGEVVVLLDLEPIVER